MTFQFLCELVAPSALPFSVRPGSPTIAISTIFLFASVASVSVALAVLIAGCHRMVQRLLSCKKSCSWSLMSDLVIRSSIGSICRVPVSCQMLNDEVL